MPVKHCDFHSEYTAGCPDCQERSRVYQAERKSGPLPRKPNKTAYGSEELWRRMTEIGLRWEREERE